MYHDRTRIREAWSAFWRDPASGQQCVRGAPDITQAMRGHWASFAASLPAGARVLDLGCGAGAASGAITAARRDLHVTGVDFAMVPPSRDARITLISDMPMEHLDFADGSFDAVVSQFGYEYGRRPHQRRRGNSRACWRRRHSSRSSCIARRKHSRRHRPRGRLDVIRTMHGPDMRAAFLAGNTFVLRTKLAALQPPRIRPTRWFRS